MNVFCLVYSAGILSPLWQLPSSLLGQLVLAEILQVFPKICVSRGWESDRLYYRECFHPFLRTSYISRSNKSKNLKQSTKNWIIKITQCYGTGWLKPQQPEQQPFSYLHLAPGQRKRWGNAFQSFSLIFFQLLLDFAWVSWSVCWRWHKMSITSLGCRLAVCNGWLHFSRWGGNVSSGSLQKDVHSSVTGQWPYQHVLSVSLSLEGAFPSLDATLR